MNNPIDEITLECLMNKEQYEKYLNKYPEHVKKNHKKDKKFYKKRIYDLTKQLLNNEPIEEKMFPDVVIAFESYIKTCINYFKILDKTDIIQEDYSDLSLLDIKTKDINVDNILNEGDANQLIMRSIKIQDPNYLEKFVKIPLNNIIILSGAMHQFGDPVKFSVCYSAAFPDMIFENIQSLLSFSSKKFDLIYIKL